MTDTGGYETAHSRPVDAQERAFTRMRDRAEGAMSTERVWLPREALTLYDEWLAVTGERDRLRADLNMASTKAVVAELDIEHWSSYAQSLEAIVRKLNTLAPGPRGREVSFSADECDALRAALAGEQEGDPT